MIGMVECLGYRTCNVSREVVGICEMCGWGRGLVMVVAGCTDPRVGDYRVNEVPGSCLRNYCGTVSHKVRKLSIPLRYTQNLR